MFIIGASLLAPGMASASYRDGNYKTGDRWLYWGGGISMSLIFLNVMLHGGFTNSFFASYFLYIPSVVAIAFKAHKGLKIVCILGFAFAAISLSCSFDGIMKLLIDDRTNIFSIQVSTYKVIFVIIVAIQFMSVYQLETQGSRV